MGSIRFDFVHRCKFYQSPIVLVKAISLTRKCKKTNYSTSSRDRTGYPDGDPTNSPISTPVNFQISCADPSISYLPTPVFRLPVCNNSGPIRYVWPDTRLPRHINETCKLRAKFCAVTNFSRIQTPTNFS